MRTKKLLQDERRNDVTRKHDSGSWKDGGDFPDIHKSTVKDFVASNLLLRKTQSGCGGDIAKSSIMRKETHT